MSALRTMTAAELAADTDEAREVWADVKRGSLCVLDAKGHSIKAVTQIRGARGPSFAFLARWDEDLAYTCHDHTRFIVEPMSPTYAALQAERDTLAAIVAAVEAEVAKLPDGCVYASNRKLEDHYDDGRQTGKYAAKQLVKRAIAEARKKDGS
jgi:hypothetical protein